MYTYYATLDRVVDGDTLDITVDLGFRICTQVRVRLAGIDTPEVYRVKKESEEYKKGMEATNFVKDWFASLESPRFLIESDKEQGKYGRWIVTVLTEDKKENLNEVLVREGYAVEVIY